MRATVGGVLEKKQPPCFLKDKTNINQNERAREAMDAYCSNLMCKGHTGMPNRPIKAKKAPIITKEQHKTPQKFGWSHIGWTLAFKQQREKKSIVEFLKGNKQ